MKLILFDIDVTILWTDGAGRRAIRRALLEELGTAGPIDAYRLDGKTDPQIVRELLELSGHPAASDERAIAAVCDRYVALLTRELESPTQRTRLLDGVPELLAALAPHEAAGRALVGLLTGNLERGAALKLRSAGLDPARFAVGAYGSDSGHRPDLPAIAAARAARKTGRSAPAPSRWRRGPTTRRRSARRARRTCSRRSPTRRRCWTRSSSERRARRAGSEGAGGRSRGGGARGDGGGSRP